MSNHSPSPFPIEYSPFENQSGAEIPSFRIYDPNGDSVAETDSSKSAATQEADARLLAAAPSLLTAAEIALERLQIGDYAGEEDAYIVQLRAAIAAARGASPRD